MGYLHIDNLYKNKTVLIFKECYALEKIHGTSAHVRYDGSEVHLFPGGIKLDAFEECLGFSKQELLSKLSSISDQITIFGEAYGGSCQKMSNVYGSKIRFVAFDVKINDAWLSVPNAEEVCKKIGLEFVDYVKTTTDIDSLNALRDAPSTQAIRNGMGNTHHREGIIIRPIVELSTNNGGRVIAKHKRQEFRETKTDRPINQEQLLVLTNAKTIADEWVTEMRVRHVLDKVEGGADITKMKDMIKAVCEDVKREGDMEIVWSKEVEKAICNASAHKIKMVLQEC